MGDRWNGGGRPASQYVFLPITITADGKMEIHFYNEWDLSLFTPERKRPVR
jgi:beta-galactosidase